MPMNAHTLRASLWPCSAGGLVMLLLAGCTPLPDTGRDVARLGPTPPLVPMDDLLMSPVPEATAETAAALVARGAALKADAAALE